MKKRKFYDNSNLDTLGSEITSPRQEELVKTIAYYTRSLAIARNFYGDQHVQVAMVLNKLGETSSNFGNFFEAIDYYNKALNILIKNYGNDHRDVAAVLNKLGKAWALFGDARQAVMFHEAALAILRNSYSSYHSAILATVKDLEIAQSALPNSANEPVNYDNPSLGSSESSLSEINGSDKPDLTIPGSNNNDIEIPTQLDTNTINNMIASIAYHSLAHVYHINALRHQQVEYLLQADHAFKMGISRNKTGSICCAYGQFLYHCALILKNYDLINKAIPFLDHAMSLGEDGSSLNYTMADTCMLPLALQKHIEREQDITISHALLANYFLIKCNLVLNETTTAKQLLTIFEIIARLSEVGKILLKDIYHLMEPITHIEIQSNTTLLFSSNNYLSTTTTTSSQTMGLNHEVCSCPQSRQK